MPAVGREVQDLDRAEEGHRDRGESESPRARVTTEFKTSEDEAEPVFGSGAREPGKVLTPMGGGAGGHLDAGQAALSLSRHELANLSRYRDLRRGRFPFVGGAEPCHGLFVGRNLGSGWNDGARAENEVEIRAGRVMPDEGRIGNGIEVAGQIDREDVDVDLYEGGCAALAPLEIGKEAVARDAAAERAVSWEC